MFTHDGPCLHFQIRREGLEVSKRARAWLLTAVFAAALSTSAPRAQAPAPEELRQRLDERQNQLRGAQESLKASPPANCPEMSKTLS